MAVVPREMAALAGWVTDRPRVSQPLSDPVAMRGRPPGTPESAAKAAVVWPMVWPEGTSRHSFSWGML